MFAFARDGGLPFKNLLLKVNSNTQEAKAFTDKVLARQEPDSTRLRHFHSGFRLLTLPHQSRFQRGLQRHHLSPATRTNDYILHIHRMRVIPAALQLQRASTCGMELR